MRLVEDAEFRQEIIDRITPPERRDGLIHASHLLNCLQAAYYDLIDPLPHLDKSKMNFARGLGLQAVLFGDDEDSIECDGIYLSADRLSVVRDERLVEELKTAMMWKFEMKGSWEKQIKGYCYANKTLMARLAVFSLPVSDIWAWRVYFSQDELDLHWLWMQGRRFELACALLLGRRPDTKPDRADAYLCRNCQYTMRCGGAVKPKTKGKK